MSLRPAIQQKFKDKLGGIDALLLGVDWGHLTYMDNGRPANTAMAGVVPAWKILDILNMKELQEERERLEAEPDKPGMVPD